MAEAHTFTPHRPVDHPAARIAAEAAPQVLGHAHRQRRRVVVMERAAPYHVAAPLGELHARGLDKPDQAHLGLDSLDLAFRDSRHKNRPPPELCQVGFL